MTNLAAIIFEPESQAGAHYWLSVLLAHAFLGLVLTGAVACLTGLMRAVVIVSFGYAMGWEVLTQRLGAGLADAAVDALAVTCGALIAWGAWARVGRRIAGAVVVLIALGGAGLWRRRK